MQELITRAKELLADGTVSRVLGWKKGDMGWDPEPAYFEKEEELENFVYNPFCGANLSKYLIAAGKLEGTTLVFLKPCDTYSFNQLIKEHRVKREKTYIIGVGCHGTLKAEKVRDAGIKGIEDAVIDGDTLKVKTIYGAKEMPLMDALLERCKVCKGRTHVIYDELIGAEEGEEAGPVGLAGDRFAKVEELEAMSPKERFAFWQGELSKCIRCNACRNVCPACSCLKCVFDSNQFDSNQKANADTFEEQMFHIIRAFHVAGRCTDCGECSRVCPQGIPLQLLNRKFIKDINTFYGEYQAGADTESRAPLTDFTFEDVEPGIVGERGGGR
ncbi:MAG TPA: 4Fe-4S dicluster domain-containing protein [Candidatus Merdisoma merdipullorum]|nr:4Fe-4S dicluster domain-containing protein [Candidatus Merdisoma merdipullorum]